MGHFRIFVNREQEIAAFQRLLAHVDPRVWILAFAGESGTGKSSLLRTLHGDYLPAGYHSVWLDFTSARLSADTLAVVTEFAESLRVRLTANAWEALKHVLVSEDTHLAHLQCALTVRQEITVIGGQITNVSQASEQARIIVETKERVLEVVTLALLDAIEKVDCPVAVFVDAFEKLATPESRLLDWFLAFMDRVRRRLAGDFFLVAAGWSTLSRGSVEETIDQHYLLPFDPPTHERLVRAHGLTDPELIDALYGLTSGYPLHAEIAVQIWKDRGRSWKARDVFKFAGQFNQSARDAWIVARVIEKLDQPCRDVVRLGVVLRRFNYELIEHLFPGLDENSFSILVAYPFIGPLPDGWFMFHEQLARIQGVFLRAHRPAEYRDIHRRAHSWFRSHTGAAGDETLRSEVVSLFELEELHHLGALNPVSAVERFVELARKAIGQHDLAGARMLLAETKSLVLKLADRARVEYYAGLLAYLGENWSEAVNQLTPLVDDERYPPKLRADACEILASVAYKRGLVPAAMAFFEKVLSWRNSLGDVQGTAYLLSNVGSDIYRSSGDWVAAEDCLKRSIGIFEDLGDKFGLARALLQLGNLYRLRGRLQDASSTLEACGALYQELGNRYYAAVASFTIGRTSMQAGDLARAEELHTSAMTTLSEMGEGFSFAMALRNLADVRMRQGRYLEAESLYLRALGIFRDYDSDVEAARVLGDLGTLEVENGPIPAAIGYFRQAMVEKEALGDEYGVAVTSYHWAEALTMEDRYEDAIPYLKRALPLLDRHPNALLKTNLLVLLCYCFEQTGHTAQAQEVARVAGSTDAQRVSGELPKLLLVKGARARREGRLSDCIDCWREAIVCAWQGAARAPEPLQATLDNLRRYLEQGERPEEKRDLASRLLAALEAEAGPPAVVEPLHVWLASLPTDLTDPARTG
jgi:tetratricopeptide (TPR) repeat protein